MKIEILLGINDERMEGSPQRACEYGTQLVTSDLSRSAVYREKNGRKIGGRQKILSPLPAAKKKLTY